MYLTKRQREIYEFIRNQIPKKGYAPSIMEICNRFQLSSPATVHKHLTHLESKGLIRRFQNQSRGIELVKEMDGLLVGQYPFLGCIAAGQPIEVVEQKEMMSLLPNNLGNDVFLLRVKGSSMIEDHIQDGDYVIVERRNEAKNGETVVALLDNENATLKRSDVFILFTSESGTICF